MAPESNKMMRQLSGDIISNLPRDVMDNILTRLPLCEAGRTSILARRWRYMWANLPSLEFDYYYTFTQTTQKSQDALPFTIHEVLLLKRVPIVKFVLSVPGPKSRRQIDPLLSFVSTNGCFKELSLVIYGDEPYKLPASLFSCVELTRLSLRNCAIEPPIQFKGFNRLVSMEIYYYSFILPGVLSDLISSCPLLEELKVADLYPADGHIQISAPNLRYLNYTGRLASISFKYTPCLSSCVLFLCDSTLTREVSNAFQSFCNLVAVEDMKIDFHYDGDELVDNNSLPRKLTTGLNNLKSLTLRYISFHVLYEVSLVLCLIRSSPNLKKIVFLAVQPGETNAADLEQVTHLLEVKEWSEISLNCLRKVEVHEITGKAWELGFIKLLLAISPNLETMAVTSDATDVTLQESLEISTKMTRFCRSSSLAEIIYKY